MYFVVKCKCWLNRIRFFKQREKECGENKQKHHRIRRGCALTLWSLVFFCLCWFDVDTGRDTNISSRFLPVTRTQLNKNSHNYRIAHKNGISNDRLTGSWFGYAIMNVIHKWIFFCTDIPLAAFSLFKFLWWIFICITWTLSLSIFCLATIASFTGVPMCVCLKQFIQFASVMSKYRILLHLTAWNPTRTASKKRNAQNFIPLLDRMFWKL